MKIIKFNYKKSHFHILFIDGKKFFLKKILNQIFNKTIRVSSYLYISKDISNKKVLRPKFSWNLGNRFVEQQTLQITFVLRFLSCFSIFAVFAQNISPIRQEMIRPNISQLNNRFIKENSHKSEPLGY